jgi:hypothetical protein
MISIPSVSELTEKLAKAKSEKAAAAAQAHAVEEDKQKALVEKLSHQNLPEETIVEKAVILVNRAVENGQTSVEVFRFPHALCTDNGRAIGQLEPGWEKTLVGVPKEIYEFWEHQLKPKGYHISVAIIDYPGGMPGDIGITLSWPDEFTDRK